MYKEIELSNGEILQFPEQMTDEQIKAAIDAEYPQKSTMEAIGDGLLATGETLLRGTADLPLGIAQTIAEQFPENELAKGVRETVGRITSETERIAEQAPLGGLIRAVPQALQIPTMGAPTMLGRAGVAAGIGGAASAVQPTTDVERGALESGVDRGVQGAIGATLGLVLTPAMEAALGKAAQSSYIGKMFKQTIPEEKLTNAEKFLGTAMGADDAAQTAKVMAQSAKEGVAEPLFSATETPVMRAYANVISRSGDKTLQAKQALDKYIASATTKEQALLSELSGLASTADDAAFVFKGGIETIKGAAKQARKAAADPIYEIAKKEALPDDVVASLLSKQTIKDALLIAKKELPDDFAELAPNSVGQFDLASRFLKGSARSEKNPTIRGAQEKFAKMIDDALLSSSDSLKKARSIYAEESVDLNQLLGLDKKTLAAKVLDAPDPLTATQRLFKGSPSEIKQTRELFKKYGMEDSFDAGVKAHIVKKLNDIRGGNANLGKAFANQTERNQLVAALGKDKAAAFIKMLNLNERLIRGKAALGGSPTQPLASAAMDIQESAQRGAGKVISTGLKAYGSLTSPRETAASLSKQWQNPKFTTEVANILFDPEIGMKFTQKIMKAKDQQAANQIINEINNLAIQRMAEKAAVTTSINVNQGE